MRNAKPKSLAPSRPHRRRRDDWAFSGMLFRLRPRLEVMEDRTLLTAFLVTNTDNSGPGSLRQAILSANAVKGSGDVIDFAIPGAGVHAIEPSSALPPITGSVLIDGTSQPGYEGAPLIEINGSRTSAGNGLTMTGSGSTVRGLAIDGFASGAAILIEGPTASHNAIYGNQLGLNAGDLLAGGNLYGVEVLNGAHDNDIGSNSPGGANAIGGNTATGVLLSGASIEASQGFGGTAGDLTLNGAATIQGSRLQLAASRASVFTSKPVDVTGFNTQFTFQLASSVTGEFSFTIQRQGPGYLGYEGIGQSVTVAFDTDSTYNEGSSTTGLFADGATPLAFGIISLAGTGIDLHSGDVFQASLSYDGKGLSVTITDTATGAAATQVYSVDIPGTVGGPTADVGFTASVQAASTSGPSAPVEDILGWSYTGSGGVVGNRVAGNAITDNGGPGVAVIGNDSTGNTIGANTISGNAGPAIDESGDGPNGLPDPPVIIATAGGGLGGRLRAGLPDAVYHLDFFASAGYAADGSGEAQDYLGSLNVTTDSHGQATFLVPFTTPDDLPIVTATATDSLGNTSEVSGLRTGTILAPATGFRVTPGQPLVFASEGFAFQDPGAGPLDPTWNLTLSVPVGTLNLPTVPGLTGSDSGTGTLQLQGTLTVIEAVVADLVFTPPPGFHGNTTLSVTAASAGAARIESALNITDGTFVVASVADSGPGSLRQAILDSNAAGGSNTIAFALPGTGVQTIALASPLPQVTTPTLIDGSTQPGFAGSALVALAGQWAGATGGLDVLGSFLSVRSVAVDAYAFGTDGLPASVTIESAPSLSSTGVNPGHADRYQVDMAADGRLLAQVPAGALATSLLLLDSRGNVLDESDGQGTGTLGDQIDQHLPAGTYFLMVEISGGAGDSVLKAAFTPTSTAFQSTKLPMVIGDFNGDGIPDIAMFDGVHLGVGDGTFRSPLAGLGLPAGDTYGPMVAGDFNGDGKLDLAIADISNNTVLLLLGNGDGTFQTGTTYVAAELQMDYGNSLVAGDFNGDGKLDLALDWSIGARIDVLLGNGDGTFQPPQVYQFSGFNDPGPMVAGDFNNDGKLDLAVANLEGTIDVLLGHGDGTFGVGPYRLPVVTGADLDIASLVAGDFNRDGKLDLAASSSDDANIEVFLGNGDGSFQGPTDYPVKFSGTTIYAGDSNGDGELDLILWGGSGYTIYGGDAFIWLLAGNGDGTFQTPRSIGQIASSPRVLGVLTGDFNGDGKLDLIEAVDQPNSLGVLLGNGDGTFQASGSAGPTDTLPSSVALGDFNGDGRVDMAVPSVPLGSITILLGDGEGGFRIGQVISLGKVMAFGTPVVADFNGDGRLDLAIAFYIDSSSDDLVVLLGNGDGTFQTKFSTIPLPIVSVDISGVRRFQMAVGDFNGDGRPDLAEIGGNGSPVVLLGNGDGTFHAGPFNTNNVLQGPVSAYNSLVVGDFNEDGRLDLAIEESFGGYGVIYVYLGDGNGGFLPSPSAELTGANVGDHLVAGDFNGDGKLDLATLNDGGVSSSISVYLGNGDGTFGPPITDPVPASGSLVAGNFYGDGKLDLASLDPSGAGIVLLRGNGDGTFQPAETVPSPPDLDNSLYSGDLNGDGRPDLILPDLYSGTITTLLNNGDGKFSSPGEVVTNPQDTPLVVDISGDGSRDVLLVDGSGNILYRQGNPQAPGGFFPPVTINPGFPSRDIAWVPNTLEGPLLASVDAQDDAVSLYAYRNGGFVRAGSLTTGQLPAQIVAADLNHDGWKDLVVRNAGDGTLSVFLNSGRGSFWTGFNNPFGPPVTIPVGRGVSDLQAVDTTGDGSPDLVVTNAYSGQVSVLLNRGDGRFAPPVSYRAGISLSGFDTSSGSIQITSQEATKSVASGSLAPGSPISLITTNPGSNTLDLLQGLGGGHFGNPTVLLSAITASVVRSADFNHDGSLDLAVLDGQGVSIYLGDGKGGFLPPVTYDAGPDPTGLTIADVNGDGNPDLLIGNAYGDVLVLLNQGNGTFLPYRNADQSVALAVADLTGDGSKDVIYADQSLDRVVVDYGGGNSAVLGDRSSGLLSPGAVKLADMNGDGIPDLIVANSGSNNVLVYPGLGNGQFGPAANGGHGFFTGTNPIGLYVADLNGDGIPDLVVANSGSNDVSVLLGQGTGSSWTMIAGPRIKTDAGPVAVAVGSLLGSGQVDLAVANQQANNVEIFPGVGNGFFNDTAPVTYPVGQAPSGLFLGNFTGSGQSIATLNAGSNTISLIGQGGVTQTIGAGGLRPVAGFAGDFSGNGFTDLVVGDNGDGRFALFTGGPAALSLSQTVTSAEAPSPTSLSFAGVTDGVLSFYASTAGRETASLLAFNLDQGASVSGSLTGEGLATGTEQSTGSVLASATAGVFQQVAQLLNLNGSALDLVAPLFTVSVIGGEFEVGSSGGGGVALIANFQPGAGPATLGQAIRLSGSSTEGGAAGNAGSPVEKAAEETALEGSMLPPWAGMAMGLEKAWRQVRIHVLEQGGVSQEAADRAVTAPSRTTPGAPIRERSSTGSDSRHQGTPPATGSKAQLAPTTVRPGDDSEPRMSASPGVIDVATEDLVAERDSERRPPRESSGWLDELTAVHHDRLAGPIAAAVAVAAATTIVACVKSDRLGRGRVRRIPDSPRVILGGRGSFRRPTGTNPPQVYERSY
ncbi:MAG: FG-GAP-like repeat-containing protein [Isosphaerales bacterium]